MSNFAVRFRSLFVYLFLMDMKTDPLTRPPFTAASARPASASDFAWALVAMGVSLVLVWAAAPWHAYSAWLKLLPYTPIIPCVGIASVFIAVGFFESVTHRVATADAMPSTHSLQLGRVAVRLCGVVATMALIALVYWLLPEYHNDFYEPYWRYLKTLAPLAVLIPVYLVWADRRFDPQGDEYLQFGYLLIGGWKAVDASVIRHHLLAWLVKAYFLPLMTVYLSRELKSFYDAILHSGQGTMHAYQMLFHLCYLTDLLFAVVGYTLTMRLLKNQIRSVEPTVAGWVVALMCYQPFVSVISRAYTSYEDKTYWDNLLQSWPTIQLGIGILIVSLTLVYCLSTAAFGIRFSNLTHRGIITNGPYRFSKHPAYLSKNLSWWLISVPMFSELGWTGALRNCCLLILLNLIYYARARTEERHLSGDPVYVEYAQWMNEHGLLAPLSRWLPFIRYRRAAHPRDIREDRSPMRNETAG